MRSLTQQLLLFGGKGGVGKTTIAAATAVQLARGNAGQKTLLFSTDPAHSLSDSLEQRIGDRVTPVAGAPGLFALEMEATQLLDDLRQEYVAEINEVFEAFLGASFDAPFDRQVMEELIRLTPPGLDELMALMKIMDFMDTGTFDRYILDATAACAASADRCRALPVYCRHDPRSHGGAGDGPAPAAPDRTLHHM
ncbi:MAG: ArsA family ATPase [Chloroflexi bacterium]|nr:ArsA family ATPase [Chloroflexota bacterium]